MPSASSSGLLSSPAIASNGSSKARRPKTPPQKVWPYLFGVWKCGIPFPPPAKSCPVCLNTSSEPPKAPCSIALAACLFGARTFCPCLRASRAAAEDLKETNFWNPVFVSLITQPAGDNPSGSIKLTGLFWTLIRSCAPAAKKVSALISACYLVLGRYIKEHNSKQKL